MNPDCLLQFITHGQKVERVIVLMHGYTDCPAQFHESGARFYDWGDNVLVLPNWSLTDRIADKQAQLSANELAEYADEVIELLMGLAIK